MIDEVVDALNAQGAAWLWFAIGMRNGDMLHVASLAAAFKKEHGTDLPIRLIVTIEPTRDVAKIFQQHFSSVHVEPLLLPSEFDWRDFFVRRRLPFFGPGIPLVLHPDLSPRTSSLHRFIAENQIIWGQVYKQALNLPADVEPEPPAFRTDRNIEAAALLQQNRMTPGRTLILFPYAQSFPAQAAGHFSLLAERARADGWDTFTSVAPGEQAIEGTQAVFIPFELLLEVGEQAGWIVALRSGICDILATANCRKTFVFTHRRDLAVWGVDALELAHDPRQIAFSFDTDSPDNFCARVLGRQSDRLDEGRRRLSDGVGSPPSLETQDFTDHLLGERPVVSGRKPLFGANKIVATRLINLPRRDHPRFAKHAEKAVREQVDRYNRGRYFTCRDKAGTSDFFEEVDRSSLLAGRYVAANKWHTVIATSGEGLDPILASHLRAKVLGRRTFELGHFQHIGRAFGTAPHRAQVDGERPLDLSGLQLLDGWYDLEPWGVWSRGDQSVLKFSVPEKPIAPVTLELECKLVVTQLDDVLNLVARANGQDVLQRQVRQNGDLQLRISIQPELMVDRTAYIELLHPGARSPMRLGDSQDARRIAVGLVGANLRHGA